MKNGFLIIAHNPIGMAFQEALVKIFGVVPECVFVDIDSDEAQDKIVNKIRQARLSLKTEQIVMIQDIPGAHPANMAGIACKGESIPTIYPLSMPLLFKLIGNRNLPLGDLLEKAKDVKTTVGF